MNQSQTQPIRVGLIGAGGIARSHAQALKKAPGVTFAAVCDRDEHKAATLQQAFGVPHVFRSVSDMARQASLDAVHVLVPPALHAPVAIECLEAGWHVFVEKPFATTREECRQMEAAALRAGRHLGVNHNGTFVPAFLRLLGDIRARRFGRIDAVQACFSVPMPLLAMGQHGHWMFARPGNIVLELGVHPLSAIVRVMGPVEKATTVVSGHRILNHGSPFFETWQMLLTCERGPAQCYFSVGGEFPETWIFVVGQDGTAMVDLQRSTYAFSTKTRFVKPVEDCVDALRRSVSLAGGAFGNLAGFARGLLGWSPTTDVFSVAMRNSVMAFHDAIARNTVPPIGSLEGSALVDACLAVTESVREGEMHHVQR